MAVAVPLARSDHEQLQPISLDFATSIVAGGKIGVKANRREKVEPGVLLDEEGEPTEDPWPFSKERKGARECCGQWLCNCRC
jgi:LDH2 family malate/lactate/ureidoglycolate dehydrogenase